MATYTIEFPGHGFTATFEELPLSRFLEVLAAPDSVPSVCREQLVSIEGADPPSHVWNDVTLAWATGLGKPGGVGCWPLHSETAPPSSENGSKPTPSDGGMVYSLQRRDDGPPTMISRPRE